MRQCGCGSRGIALARAVPPVAQPLEISPTHATLSAHHLLSFYLPHWAPPSLSRAGGILEVRAASVLSWVFSFP